MDDKKRELFNKIAAVISWAWSLLYLLGFALVSFLAVSGNSLKESVLYLTSVFLFFLIYGFIGFGLVRFMKLAGYFSLFISGLNLLLGILILLAGRNIQGLFPLVLGGAMFVFTLLGWKTLR